MPTVCDRCGAQLTDESRYCDQCGKLRQFKPRPTLHRTWWRVLLVGLVLYWATATLLASTGNPNMIPTVILLGAFLVPVTCVVYLLDGAASTSSGSPPRLDPFRDFGLEIPPSHF